MNEVVWSYVIAGYIVGAVTTVTVLLVTIPHHLEEEDAAMGLAVGFFLWPLIVLGAIFLVLAKIGKSLRK